MKGLSVFLFILVIACHACSRHDDFRPSLDRIDSLMETRPDDALLLLQEIDPEQLEDEREKMLHTLLTVEAECRNGRTPTDDSLLLPVIDYFHYIGDLYREARAEYNRGHILYKDRRQAGKALEAYLRAKMLLKECGNTRWMGKTYSRIGHIYHSQGMFSRADFYYQQAEQLSLQTGDTALWLEASERRSIYLMGQGETHYKEAETRLLQIYRIACRSGFKSHQTRCALTLSHLYSFMQDGKQTLHFAQEALKQETDTENRCIAYLLAGEAYYKLNHYDSATTWLEKTIRENPSLPIRLSAYMRLGEIAEEQGDTKKALAYQKKYHQAENELHSQSQATEVQLAEQKQTHRKQLDDARFVINCCLAVAGIMALLTLSLWALRVKEQRHNRQRMQALILLWMQEHWNLLPQASPTATAASTETARPFLPLLGEKAAMHPFDFHQLLVRLRTTEIHAKINRILDYYKTFNDYQEHFTADDQERLLYIINQCTEGFIEYLETKYPDLSASDLRFCALHLLGLSTREIAILLEKDRTGVYKRQKRIIKEKFSHSSETKLEKVLKSI